MNAVGLVSITCTLTRATDIILFLPLRSIFEAHTFFTETEVFYATRYYKFQQNTYIDAVGL